MIASNVVALHDEVADFTSNELTGNVAQFDQDGNFVAATLLLIDPAQIDLSQSLTT